MTSNFPADEQLQTREEFTQRLHQLLDRQNAVLGMVLIKNMARINSQYGADVGDSLIQEFGKMLGSIHGLESVGKISPALYSLLSKDWERPRTFLALITEAVAKLNRSNRFPFLIEISLGATVAQNAHDRNVDSLFEQANLAMVNSGRIGDPQIFHESTALEATIRDILGRLTAEDSPPEGMYWVYQPINSVVDGRIFAYEALCRWVIPGLGSISPAVFIPLAEEIGVIEYIDRWGLMSLEKTHTKLFEGGGHCVSFNLSARTLESDNDFSTLIKEMLERNRDCGCELIIEMTETAVAENRGRLLAQLHELRSHGVKIAIDDFGSGLTSLGSIAEVSFDYLKVDGSLLHIDDAHKAKGLLEISNKLAHLLGAKVIVEGVETLAELEMVRSTGADYAQGWYFGQPVDPRDLPVSK